MIGASDWLVDNWIAIVAAIISGLAALASIVAARRSIAAQNRLLEIEEQREEDRVSETRKARLVARVIREPPPPGRMGNTPDFFLEIENRGQSAARDIAITLDGGPVLDRQTIPQGTEEVLYVGAVSSFRYALAPTLSTRPPQRITIAWDDDSGERGHYETTLT